MYLIRLILFLFILSISIYAPYKAFIGDIPHKDNSILEVNNGDIFYDFEENLIDNITIGSGNYCRVTVPPMIWFGFKGLSLETSYILNISDTSHDPLEVERQPLTFLNFLTKLNLFHSSYFFCRFSSNL